MKLNPYRVVEAESVEILAEKCSALMNIESEDDGFMYYYVPLDNPIITNDAYGQHIWYQVFVIMSYPIGADEIPGELLPH